MTLREHRRLLVAAIGRAVGEHGYPNCFSCGELHRLYGGPRPQIAGRIAADTWLFRQLREETSMGKQLSYNSVHKKFCV